MWVVRAQYKFVVDGEWRYAPDQAAMFDEVNNVNNVLEVQEYTPENLDSLSGFDPPPSPPSRFPPAPRPPLPPPSPSSQILGFVLSLPVCPPCLSFSAPS